MPSILLFLIFAFFHEILDTLTSLGPLKILQMKRSETDKIWLNCSKLMSTLWSSRCLILRGHKPKRLGATEIVYHNHTFINRMHGKDTVPRIAYMMCHSLKRKLHWQEENK